MNTAGETQNVMDDLSRSTTLKTIITEKKYKSTRGAQTKKKKERPKDKTDFSLWLDMSAVNSCEG